MNSRDLDHLLRQVRWPEPPQELRARVLSQATVRPEVITWSDRVWFSRTWRLSTAAATVALLVVQLWSASKVPARFTQTPVVAAEVRMIEEVVREAGLPREFAVSIARREVARRPRAVGARLVAEELFDLENQR
jgi:hypothetical protein